MPLHSRPITIFVKGVKDESTQLGAIGIAYEDVQYGDPWREQVPSYYAPLTENTATFYAIMRALKCHPSTRRGEPGVEIDIVCDDEFCVAMMLLYKAAKTSDIEDFDDFVPSDAWAIKQIMRQLQFRKRDTVHFTFMRSTKRGPHKEAIAIANVELHKAMKRKALNSPSTIERDLELLSVTSVNDE